MSQLLIVTFVKSPFPREVHASVFGSYRIRIDPWEVDYGDQTPLASPEERPDQEVEHEVEIADGQWTAVTPKGTARLPQSVVFVDGVRRLEARVLARDGVHLIYGGFGSHAVGAVEVRDTKASFGQIRVFRTAVLGSGQRLPSPVQVHDDLVYTAESTPATEVDGPLRHIQKSMRLAESTLVPCWPSFVGIGFRPYRQTPMPRCNGSRIRFRTRLRQQGTSA